MCPHDLHIENKSWILSKRDVAAANDKVMDKQKEVDDARRVLDQKLVELRALRADADVQATKLGSVVDRVVTRAMRSTTCATGKGALRAHYAEIA